jgi:Na+-translocating ferredoxin:NAD+ oxidoreductase subunit C
MAKYIHIEENPNIKCNKTIKEFLDPDYIYIPYSKDYKLNIHNHELVLKEEILLSNDKKYIYSTVSGIVSGITKMIVDNEIKPCIIIENNYEEKTKKLRFSKKNINEYQKEDVLNLINGLNAYRGNLEGETLIIDGIDYEPYENTMSYLISKYSSELLECIDALYNIFNIHKCFLAITNNDSENVNELVNYIGTYPNIDLKLMPDLYPIGNKQILINELVSKEKITKGIIFLTVEDVYTIYNVLKRNKPITEKLVTFAGDLLDKSKVMNVKIGTSIKDILINDFKIKDENYHIIINGLLSGYEIKSLDAIITPNIRSVFINSINNEPEKECLNCGMCTSFCPIQANPRTGKNMQNCIKCGICDYICPSKRNLMENKHE